MAIIRDAYYADEYEISAADFHQLRAMGILTEAEQVPVRSRAAEQQPVSPLATANCSVADRYQDASASRPEVRCDPSRE